MSTNRWLIFTICSLLFVMSMLFRASIVIIAPELSHDLNLSSEDLGLLGAVFFYAFAAAQLPLGFFLDRLRPRRTMLFLNLAAVVGAIIFAAAQGLGLGLLARALLGFGMSANIVGSLTLYVSWFKPSEFATAAGLTFAMGALGGLLATSPLHAFVASFGWRMAFIVLALITFVLTAAFFLFVKDSSEKSAAVSVESGKTPHISIRETIRTLLFDFSYVCIAVMTGLRYGVYAAVQSLWAGPFLILHLGLPTATAAHLLLLLNVGFIFGGPTGGVLSDRIIRRPKRIMLASLVFMAVCVTALAGYPGPVNIPLLAGILFVFGFFGGFGHIGFAHIKALIPPQMSGRAFAIANCCSMLGGGLFLQGLGSLLNRGSSAGLAAGADYPLAFMLCAAALGVSVIIYLFSRDPLVNDPKPVASMSN